MKTYGPYVAKDGRYRCVLVHENGRKQTISYPRLLMETHLGRSLLSDEDVHHIDENIANNNIDNLKVILHSEHCRNHSLKYIDDILIECVYCRKIFTLTPHQQRKRQQNKNKSGPFCSRRCSGKYGSDVQRATKQECLD